MIQIRNEQPHDYQRVEEITRKAFYNLYLPGGTEHYLVHIMRTHEDFLPELDFVIEKDGAIIGNVMYTKTRLIDEAGDEKRILTFGPVCIALDEQRRGYGKLLLEHSFERARTLGYDVIVIFGVPGNYVSRGFVSCKKFNISLSDGTFPTSMMVLELNPGALDGRKWVYHQSSVFEFDEQEAERYDSTLEPMEKKRLPCQEEFYMLSNSILR